MTAIPLTKADICVVAVLVAFAVALLDHALTCALSRRKKVRR